MESLFSDADLIHSYGRAQAIEDGELVDVSTVAREAGAHYPVAMTRAAWASCVEWTAADNARKGTAQDESGRLWDVCYMMAHAIRSGKVRGDRGMFSLVCVPRDGKARRPRPVTLKVMCGPGDDPAPVLTIMLPDED